MGSITVVIPALNDARFLEVCLDALAKQTRQADAIIVVDNGSNDDTAAVARAAGATVLYQAERGIFAAASTGYDAVTSDIIARLDADSVPPADWLERVDAALAGADPLSSVTGPGDFYGSNPLTALLGRVLYIGGFFWSMTILLGHPPVFGSNFAMHRGVWERIRTKVHRNIRHIHDDIDLSMHLTPDMSVIYDGSLRVGISARPFETLPGILRRVNWAVLTLWINGRESSFWKRRRVRMLAREAAPER